MDSNRPVAVPHHGLLLGSPIEDANTDEKFAMVFDAIRQLIATPEPKMKSGIGFLARLEK